MKFRKLLTIALAGITAAATMVTTASADIFRIPDEELYIANEGDVFSPLNTADNWLLQVYNEGNEKENKPKVDYGVDVTKIAQVILVIEPAGDYAEFFEGRWGGNVLFSANGGILGTASSPLGSDEAANYAKYNWPANEWWGVWNIGTYQQLKDEVIDADGITTFATMDPTKEVKTMPTADGKWAIVYNVPEEDRYIEGGTCYQIGLQDWGSDLAEIKVDYCILNDAEGNNLLTVDETGKPVDPVTVEPANEYYAALAYGATEEEMLAMEAPAKAPEKTPEETPEEDEDNTTGDLLDLDIDLNVENRKGWYSFTDEEYEAFINHCVEILGSDLTITRCDVSIFGDDSSLTATDGNNYTRNHVYAIEFEFVDIQKDADGKTTFKELDMADKTIPVVSGQRIWGPGCYSWDSSLDDASVSEATLPMSELNEAMDTWGKFDWGDLADDGSTLIKGYTHQDVDMVIVILHTNDKFDENGKVMYPWTFDYTTGKSVLAPGNNPKFVFLPVLTENGAAMLNEANSNATPEPETPTAPAVEFQVAEGEAYSADDFADIIAENADSDVVIKCDNGVSFKFEKGTMGTVDGIEAYDFTSIISTVFSEVLEAVSDKLTKENFVLDVNYAYSGKLPAAAEITIPVGTEYAGKTLYYSKKLESGVTLIDTAIVDENGFITVKQDSCSDYLLTTEDISTVSADKEAEAPADNTTNEDKTNSDTGVEGFAVVAGLAVLATGAIVVAKKKD